MQEYYIMPVTNQLRRCRDVIYVPLFSLECGVTCTGVWGCGRPRAAPANSQAEQSTVRWFILTVLWLNYLSEHYFEKVTMQVSSLCRDIFKMYLYNYVAGDTMKYTLHCATASPLAAPHTKKGKIQPILEYRALVSGVDPGSWQSACK